MLSALRIGAGLPALLVLAGCAQMSGGGLPFRAQPFASGASVSVVTSLASQIPGGEMGAFDLVPCGTGAVCTGSATGPRMAVAGSDAAMAVRGIDRDLVYHLTPGGGGFVSQNGVAVAPLAWE